MRPSTRASPMEIDLEDSDEDGEKDRPDRVCFANMMVGEGYEELASTFACNGLLVLLNIIFDQVDEFTLHSREYCNLP